MTKKKGRASFQNHRRTKKKVVGAFTQPIKTIFYTNTKNLVVSVKKFYTASKNFTPSWIARISAYSMSDY